MSKLPNAPLQEVIFEVRWSLQPDIETGQLFDTGFELGVGKLNSLVSKKFPVYKRIVPHGIPIQFFLHKVVHQYWTEKNKWPVLQLGPGIFTINCTDENYYWEEQFSKLISEGITWLSEAYQNKLNIQFANLRYIDAIDVSKDRERKSWNQIVVENFAIEYKNSFDTQGKQSQLKILQAFKLGDQSELSLEISNGTIKNKESLIWQTSLTKKDDFNHQKIMEWAEYAHGIAHRLFKEIVSADLYNTFKDEKSV